MDHEPETNMYYPEETNIDVNYKDAVKRTSELFCNLKRKDLSITSQNGPENRINETGSTRVREQLNFSDDLVNCEILWNLVNFKTHIFYRHRSLLLSICKVGACGFFDIIRKAHPRMNMLLHNSTVIDFSSAQTNCEIVIDYVIKKMNLFNQENIEVLFECLIECVKHEHFEIFKKISMLTEIDITLRNNTLIEQILWKQDFEILNFLKRNNKISFNYSNQKLVIFCIQRNLIESLEYITEPEYSEVNFKDLDLSVFLYSIRNNSVKMDLFIYKNCNFYNAQKIEILKESINSGKSELFCEVIECTDISSNYLQLVSPIDNFNNTSSNESHISIVKKKLISVNSDAKNYFERTTQKYEKKEQLI